MPYRHTSDAPGDRADHAFDYGGVVPTVDQAPAFPASTVAVRNNTGVDVMAYIANGAAAITVVVVNGITTGYQIALNDWGTVWLPAGYTVAFTYASGAPAWKWVVG